MDENIVRALSARSVSAGCLQKLDNHEWTLALLWKQNELSNSDVATQLAGRTLLMMCCTLGGHFPTIPSFILESTVVVLVHKHDGDERYGFRI
eukprot:3655879-Karenia_brevis.AAC.1